MERRRYVRNLNIRVPGGGFCMATRTGGFGMTARQREFGQIVIVRVERELVGKQIPVIRDMAGRTIGPEGAVVCIEVAGFTGFCRYVDKSDDVGLIGAGLMASLAGRLDMPACERECGLIVVEAREVRPFILVMAGSAVPV